MYDSKIAAKYMLALAQSEGIILNATQLQKILFIAYGVKLALDGGLLFNEAPKAWPFGPVFPRVQKHIDSYESYQIESNDLQEIAKDTETTELFIRLVKKYSKYSATQLSNWSHAVGSPWEQTTKQIGFKWNMAIPNILIENYFSKFDV